MEDKLEKFFESARSEGMHENDMIRKLYGERSSKELVPEYFISRCHGLSIAQAELATLLCQELTQRGTESVLLRLEGCKEKYNSTHFHKKRNRKKRHEEPELKKKTKL